MSVLSFFKSYFSQIKSVLFNKVRNSQMLGLRYSFLLFFITFVFSVYWTFVNYWVMTFIMIVPSFCFFIISIFIAKHKKVDLVNLILVYIGIHTIFASGIFIFHKFPIIISWFIGPIIFAQMFLKKTNRIIAFFVNFIYALITVRLNKYALQNCFFGIEKIQGNKYFSIFLTFSLFILIYMFIEEYKYFRDEDELELLKKNKELDESRNELIKTQKYKEEFFALISHEIRTPMNAIIGISNIVKKTELNTIQSKYIDAIQLSSNNLLVIINDLLDLSKLEAGKFAIDKKGFNIENSMQFIFSLFGNKADERNLSLILNFDDRIASILIGDQIRINQILLNLTSNAIKFTEIGFVKISCELIKDSQKDQRIKFTISDSGIGISEEFIENIFDQFSQEDTSTSRKYGGTGLGMSISKHLVEMMNGKISIESTKGIGTTITFELVLEKGTITDLPNSGSTLFETNLLKGKTILVVEDNEMNRLVAQNTLEFYGAIVKEVVNGLEAVEFLRKESVDLVLMDIGMPVMNGIKATEIIRTELKLSIPIIALTANALPEEHDRSIKVGMNDFLTKPYIEEHLIAMIAKILFKKSMPIIDEPKPVATQLYSLENIRNLGRNNIDFEKSTVKLFLKEAKKTCFEISEAFQKEDWGKFRFLTHRIKASVKILEIKEGSDIIMELEKYDPNENPQYDVTENLEKFFSIIYKVCEELEVLFPNHD